MVSEGVGLALGVYGGVCVWGWVSMGACVCIEVGVCRMADVWDVAIYQHFRVGEFGDLEVELRDTLDGNAIATRGKEQQLLLKSTTETAADSPEVSVTGCGQDLVEIF